MYKLGKSLVVAAASLMLGLSSLACAAGADRNVADALEKSLAPLVSSQDYLSATHTALRLASVRSQLGETAAACAALSQSVAYYRKALMQETGAWEAAGSSIGDDSGGVAVVRAKYGCQASERAQIARP